MNKSKIEIQPYQVAKRYRCDLCDRLENIEKRLVLWHNNQVVGDLLLCNSCLEVVQSVLLSEEQIVEEWDFQGGD